MNFIQSFDSELKTLRNLVYSDLGMTLEKLFGVNFNTFSAKLLSHGMSLRAIEAHFSTAELNLSSRNNKILKTFRQSWKLTRVVQQCSTVTIQSLVKFQHFWKWVQPNTNELTCQSLQKHCKASWNTFYRSYWNFASTEGVSKVSGGFRRKMVWASFIISLNLTWNSVEHAQCSSFQ